MPGLRFLVKWEVPFIETGRRRTTTFHCQVYSDGVNSRQKKREHARESNCLPSILKPDFDLLRLDIREDGTVFDQLLTAYGTRLGAFIVNALESFHLFIGVANVLARCIHDAPTLPFRHSHSLLYLSTHITPALCFILFCLR